ncbi:MAG: acetyltransferase [Deltaproteobacteria bacterium]|nr:acetyltransferase [Deltaproteobacteria bacterium]
MVAARGLLVFGASGHGKVVADVGRSVGFALAGFLDEDASKDCTSFCGALVISTVRLRRERHRWAGALVAMGIGDNEARQRCVELIRSLELEVSTLVHASAVVAPSARLGTGTVAMALAAVNPDAVIGEGVILNTGSVVEHDNRLGPFVHLSPKVALGGNVTIGARSHLGLGAVVLPGVSVGAGVRVGAGAVVIADVADGVTVVGVPARPTASSRGGRRRA